MNPVTGPQKQKPQRDGRVFFSFRWWPGAVLEQLAHGLTQKFLQGTLASLNQSEDAERQQLLSWLSRIFPKGSDRR